MKNNKEEGNEKLTVAIDKAAGCVDVCVNEAVLVRDVRH
jgi:hypothetical protein